MQTTPISRDGGIDGHGRLKVGLAYINVAFQCKRWQVSVGRPEVDKLRVPVKVTLNRHFLHHIGFHSEAKGCFI